MAGLRCARLIGGATAAALTYGFESRDEGARFVAVHALGGTALDIAILEVADGLFQVRATGGAPLGGADFDRHGEELSLRLRDAGLEPERVDEVLLVGEQTRSSHVRRAVHELFGKPTKRAADDGVVARGAAIRAGIKEGDVKDLVLLDVAPHTLGIETTDGTFTPLIERNSTIPTRRARLFTTVADNQRRVVVHVLEGESDQADHNTSLARLELGDLPLAPGGAPEIEVSLEIDLDGIVTVSATDQGTGRARTMTLAPSGETPTTNEIPPEGPTDLVLLDVTPHTLGIEAEDGTIVPLIERNSRIPACASRVFTTVVDGQSIVEVHVLQGESDMAAYNRSLARLELTHLPPAPRGVPQIEVAVEVGGGNVVSAVVTDRATGHTRRATIGASAWLDQTQPGPMARTPGSGLRLTGGDPAKGVRVWKPRSWRPA
jgi:molecular chaperone DnaK (HSP70)